VPLLRSIEPICLAYVMDTENCVYLFPFYLNLYPIYLPSKDNKSLEQRKTLVSSNSEEVFVPLDNKCKSHTVPTHQPEKD